LQDRRRKITSFSGKIGMFLDGTQILRLFYEKSLTIDEET